MNYIGIGKTTLANEICVKWAQDGFLAEDFDVVLLVPLRSAQKRSVKEVMVEYSGGKKAYKQVKRSGGARCLVILEGLDEIAKEHQKTDKFLVRVIESCTLLEEAVILITSRPHACEKVKAGRKVEIMGFGNKEITEFVEKSFPCDAHTVKEFLLQVNKYPHIRSFCYIPMNLVMIVDIFQMNKKLPSTLTEVYKLFVIMILLRQKKEREKLLCLPSVVPGPAAYEEVLCVMLKGIPRDTVHTVFALCRLAYCGFFDCCSNGDCNGDCNEKSKDQKVIFTIEELKQCSKEEMVNWDGYGLLKATHTHQFPEDSNIYSFAHLTIQEFLCAVYMSTSLDQEQQQRIVSKHFDDHPNVFIFLCGLSPAVVKFVFQKLKSSTGISKSRSNLTACRCAYENGETGLLQSATPFELDLSHIGFQPYDCLCVGHVLSCYPVLTVSMVGCHIDDNGAEMLGRNYSGHALQKLFLCNNGLTIDGLRHVIKIAMKS